MPLLSIVTDFTTLQIIKTSLVIYRESKLSESLKLP